MAGRNGPVSHPFCFSRRCFSPLVPTNAIIKFNFADELGWDGRGMLKPATARRFGTWALPAAKKR